MRQRAPPHAEGGRPPGSRGEGTALVAVPLLAVVGLLGALPLLPLLRPLFPGLLHLRALLLDERLGEGLPLQLLRAELLHDPRHRVAHRLLAVRAAPPARPVAAAPRHLGAVLLDLGL